MAQGENCSLLSPGSSIRIQQIIRPLFVALQMTFLMDLETIVIKPRCQSHCQTAESRDLEAK